jgi:glutamate carboxypeptidase
MKGGVVLALGVLRALAQRPDAYAEAAILLVCDEEWRTAPFAHAERFAGWNACLCFEAGELTPDGGEGVVVRRKAAARSR